MVETKARHSILLVLSQSQCQSLWTTTYHRTHFILQQRKSSIKVILNRHRNQWIEGGFWSNYYNHPKTLGIAEHDWNPISNGFFFLFSMLVHWADHTHVNMLLGFLYNIPLKSISNSMSSVLAVSYALSGHWRNIRIDKAQPRLSGNSGAADTYTVSP